MTSPNGSPTVLVGWDGATFSVLDPLMRDGTMPFLARFSAEGVRGVLRSTPHPLTPCAWTTLMTGAMPGNHGVFDFVKLDRREDRYSYVLGTSGDVCSETVWSIAGRNNRRVTCLNFPCMFPCPPVNGFVIPGFVPHQYLRRAVYPKSLYDRIRVLPGFEAQELALDWALERKALQGLPEDQYESWIRFHTLREVRWFEILQMLMREEPCELTAVLFDGVDKLQHLCYHLLDPEQNHNFQSDHSNRIRELCRAYFRQLDSFLQSITEHAGSDARVFICSDHGFRLAGDQIFYINVWLQQHGYLQWADDAALDENRHLTLEGHTATDSLFNWDATTAFALTASGNAIHILRKRQGNPGPGVSDAEYESFRRELIDSLLAFTDASGNRVVEAVFTREEAYRGAQMMEAPDLTLVLRDKSFVSVLRADATLKLRRAPYGTHDPKGIVFARGPGIRRGVEIPPAEIVNVTPTLLYSLGVPLPKDMDGVVETAAFEPSFLRSNPVRNETSKAAYEPAVADKEVRRDKDEEEALVAQLKALGYLE